MRKPIVIGLLLCGLIGVIGCSEGPKQIGVHKTTGKLVRTDGPVRNLAVIFHPVDASAPTTPLRPNGVVQEDGSFTLTSYNVGDGAPPGEYIVTISAAPVDEGAPKAMKPVLPVTKFRDPKSSPLRAKIEAKDINELQPFDITK